MSEPEARPRPPAGLIWTIDMPEGTRPRQEPSPNRHLGDARVSPVAIRAIETSVVLRAIVDVRVVAEVVNMAYPLPGFVRLVS